MGRRVGRERDAQDAPNPVRIVSGQATPLRSRQMPPQIPSATSAGSGAHAQRRQGGRLAGVQPRTPRPAPTGAFAHAQRCPVPRPRRRSSPRRRLGPARAMRSGEVGAAGGSEAASEQRPHPAERAAGAATPPRGHLRRARCSPGPSRLGAPSPSPTSAPAQPHPLRLLRQPHCTVWDGRDDVAPPLEAARPRDALGCLVGQGGKERGAHLRGGGPGKAPRPSSRLCCPPRAPLLFADHRSCGAYSWGWTPPLASAHLCPFLRNSPVGHPHLLRGSGPQSLGSWEMPDPTCEACGQPCLLLVLALLVVLPLWDLKSPFHTAPLVSPVWDKPAPF